MITSLKMERIVDKQSPFTGGKVKEVTATEQHKFRGEQYSVPVRYYVCVDTGEQFTTTDQDGEWTSSLYDQYRKRHHIPSPAQIKATRLKYGLNVSQLTRILGFGKNQISWYEEGQVPNLSNGRLLALIEDPRIMAKCVRQSAISGDEKRKILASIGKL